MNLIQALCECQVPDSQPFYGGYSRKIGMLLHLSKKGFSRWEPLKEPLPFISPESARSGHAIKIGFLLDHIRLYTGDQESKKDRTKREAKKKPPKKDTSLALRERMAEAVMEVLGKIRAAGGEDHRLEILHRFLKDDEQMKTAYDALEDNVDPKTPCVLVIDGKMMSRPVEGNDTSLSPNIPVYEEFAQNVILTELNVIEGTCVFSGEKDLIPATHPVKFQIGENRSCLLSANSSLNYRYSDKEKLQNSGIGWNTVRKYGRAFQYLLEDPNHSQHIFLKEGKIRESEYQKLIWWSTDDTNVIPFLSAVKDPSKENRIILDRVESGNLIHLTNPDNLFYYAFVSTHTGRIVVQDMHQESALEVCKRAMQWKKKTTVLGVGEEGELTRRNYSLKHLTEALLRFQSTGTGLMKSGKCHPKTSQDIFRCMFLGEPLPERVIYGLLQRISRDRFLSGPRIALLQAYLHQRGIMTSEANTYIDPQLNQHVGYLLGRYIMEMSALQQAAIPGVNTTILSQYGAGLPKNAALTYNKIDEKRHHYLHKLRRHGEHGMATIFSQRLVQITSQIGVAPRSLDRDQTSLYTKGQSDQKKAQWASDLYRRQVNKVEGLSKEEARLRKTRKEVELGLIDPTHLEKALLLQKVA